MLTFTDDGFRAQIADETGIRPPWATETFNDVEADVRPRAKNARCGP
jgi:carbonic anhydrase